jgi:DNA polymerase III alpha subunit
MVEQVTQLSNRKLWFDGDTTIKPEFLSSYVTEHDILGNLFVEEVTPAIRKFNSLVDADEKLKVKTNVNPLSFDWKLPESYASIDVNHYVFNQLEQQKLTEEQWEIRAQRVALELAKFKQMALEQVLRTIIYVIDTFKEKNIVWGVGRGSSVSSYVLYLIGVHDIDSVEYELDFNEFLHL